MPGLHNSGAAGNPGRFRHDRRVIVGLDGVTTWRSAIQRLLEISEWAASVGGHRAQHLTILTEEFPMSTLSTFRTNIVTFAAATAIALGALLPGVAVAEATQAQPTTKEIDRDLAAARAASAKYHRVEAALADGFVNTGHCVASPAGGMGFHFVHPGRLGGGIDVREPEVLLYEKDASGRFRLTGAEYIGNEGDALFGQTFTPTPAGPALHVWLWKHNPSGIFADWNPNVSC
jgi:hypothetical protein